MNNISESILINSIVGGIVQINVRLDNSITLN